MTKIIIHKYNEKKQIALIEDGKLVEYYEEEKEDTRKEGNIYIGIVKDIIKGMQSAFVDIGVDKNSFIHLKDIMPKIDETKESIDNSIEIKSIIKPNQKLLVQVKKDSTEKKGARVSTHINLPGKYIALMPNTDIITVSQKIEDEEERKRLKELVRENLSKGNGAVIRTSAKGKTQEIIEDIKKVERKWEDIIKTSVDPNLQKPELLYKSEDLTEKMLIDLADTKIDEIIVNTEKDAKKLERYKKENEEYTNTKIIIENTRNILSQCDI